MRKLQTKEDIERLFSYDPATGDFHRHGRRPSKPSARGYVIFCHLGHGYCAHRLIWIMMHPEDDISNMEIDHINGDRSDNRLKNLRLVPRALNVRNQKLFANNTSGCGGVYWSKKHSKWKVQTQVAGKSKFLGLFVNKQEAIAKINRFRSENGFTARHGNASEPKPLPTPTTNSGETDL